MFPHAGYLEKKDELAIPMIRWTLLLFCLILGNGRADGMMKTSSNSPNWGNEFDLSIMTPFELVSEAPWMILSYIFLLFSDIFYLFGCFVKKFGLLGPVLDIVLLYFISSYGTLVIDAVDQIIRPIISKANGVFNDNIKYLNSVSTSSLQNPSLGFGSNSHLKPPKIPTNISQKPSGTSSGFTKPSINRPQTIQNSGSRPLKPIVSNSEDDIYFQSPQQELLANPSQGNKVI